MKSLVEAATEDCIQGLNTELAGKFRVFGKIP